MSSVCVGMAGVDRPDDKALVHGWLRALFPDARTSVHVHSDAVTALASGTNGKLHGVVLISGTGTVAMGFKGADVSARCAGWGCVPVPSELLLLLLMLLLLLRCTLVAMPLTHMLVRWCPKTTVGRPRQRLLDRS